MKLTPMVKLMQDAGAEGFANTVMIETGALEKLRKAIISDFVNGLEPDYIQIIDIDGHEHDNLFDLLEWRNK